MVKLRSTSSAAWLECVLTQFDVFLLDHAAAEKKASGMAISMLSHYPDRPHLVKAMADLAVEELSHFRDVLKLIQKRDLQLAADQKDPYVNQLRNHVRGESEAYLLDRLMMAAVVEARGCERFALIGEAHSDPALQRFYRSLASSEARHADLFVELALHYFDETQVLGRLDTWLEWEAEAIASIPVRAALH